MRDINNEVAIWNEFGELPPRLAAFKDYILANSEGRLVVVGDNRGLLSAGLGTEREVVLVRHRNELAASKVVRFDEALKLYSRGSSRRSLFVRNGPTAAGKYEFVESHLGNPDFFELLTAGTTLVSHATLQAFYAGDAEGGEYQPLWLEALNDSALTTIVGQNLGSGLLDSAQREAKYLVKRGWPTYSVIEPYFTVSRVRLPDAPTA